MDIKEIQNLIKFVAKSGASEVKLEMGDIKITIKTGGGDDHKGEIVYMQQQPMNTPQQQQAPPQTTQAAPQQAVETKEESAESKFIIIKSPIIGTFYRKPSPDKPYFVEVGSNVKVGDPLCVIEAMKLFNEIESEISGKIVRVLVDDSSPVEFDQPLFLIDPS